MLGLVLVAGCGGAPERPTAPPALELAERTSAFPLYYAGEHVDGLPLVAVRRRAGTATYVSFVYGDCTPVPDSGCAPPLEIQVWPSSARGRNSYDTAAPGAPRPAPALVGGLCGVLVAGERLELYTDESTVVVFASSPSLLERTSAALRPLGAGDPPLATAIRC